MAEPQVPPTPDPFAAMGGGVYENGGWKPNTMVNPSAVAAPAPAPAAAPAPAPIAGPQTGATPQSIQGAYQDAMQNILKGPSPEAYAAGAAKGPEAAAYRIASQRGLERGQAQNAESSAYSGLSNAGGRDRAMRSAAAEGEAQFVGNLTGQRMNDRRQELMQAMQLAAAQGDSAAARDLQMKLAQMDQALRDKGLNIQQGLGDADIGLRRDQMNNQFTLGNRDLDLRKLLGMTGYGLDAASLQQGANQSALMALLGS